MCGLKLPWDSFYRIPGRLFFFSVVFFKPVFGLWKYHREHSLGAAGLFKTQFWSLERLLGDHLAFGGLFQSHFVTRKSPAERHYINRWSLWRLWKDHKIWRMPYFFCSFRLAASRRMNRWRRSAPDNCHAYGGSRARMSAKNP